MKEIIGLVIAILGGCVAIAEAVDRYDQDKKDKKDK